ncbi:MAG: hypothetical protein NTX61_03920 [Bacteroidetes bacterium]|nr:hypothetical protein [Bacteroidota bacterium]
MEKFYRLLSKVLIVVLVSIIPFTLSAQTQTKKADQTKQETKKEETTKVKDGAPGWKYWSVTAFGGANQFNGDLSANLFLNDKWKFGAGAMLTKQFSRVIAFRGKFGWTPLTATVEHKFVPLGLEGTQGSEYIHQKFTSYVLEADIHATINFINWIMGDNPERFFSSYLIIGAGMDHTQGSKWDLNTGKEIGYIGYPGHKGKDWGYDPITQGIGNNSGIGKWNLEFTTIAGLGFDFNINRHWSINPEILWRWRDGDVLDLTKGGAMQVKNDMFSGANLGLTYKFAYAGGNIKDMAKKYSLVKYEVIPPVLTEKGDSVMVTIKGTFPQKYFGARVGMYFQPQIQYAGGSYDLKPMNIMGEKVTGDGPQIKYKEGGTFTYTTVFPYKPEMSTSELVVAPVIYDAKDKKVLKKEELKNAKNIILPSRDLAPGVIYTPTRIQADAAPMLADHGYQKEVFQAKGTILYFKVNVYKLDLKFGINKEQASGDNRLALDNFIKQGWKIKDININGWASPEGPLDLNTTLSENRAKSGNTYVVGQFQSWVKENEKANKDKKAVKAMVDAAGKDVNFVVDHHGPDWNGFLKGVQESNLKDKDKILNVINSAGDNKRKEVEIKKMILIYPELEKQLLPPLRRTEITANLYEPRHTDEELSKLAVSNPEQLKVEEILYAGTLTTDKDTKATIYDNAARLFPTNWKALNNAAFANIQKGNYDKAGKYLVDAEKINANSNLIENNIGVVAQKTGDMKKAEAQFKKTQQMGENESYNLGVLLIPKGEYSKALTMMANAKCTYNLGLGQLVAGKTSDAVTTLGCAPQTPETFYLLAICGARNKDTKMLYDNLMKAVTNPKLKEEAKGDREFYNYMNTQDFKNIVK